MKALLYVIAVPFASFAGLAAFSSWWSALLYVVALGLFGFYAARRHEKHHRSEAHDDRSTTERMESAREWLVNNSDD